MKRSTAGLAAGAALAVIGLLAWALAPRPLEVETTAAVQGRFEAAIEEDGRTRLIDRYVVTAPLAGRLERVALREGDRVEAGAVLARIRPALAPLQDERTLREQQAQLEMAQAGLQRAEARLERARIARQQAANESLRSEQLAQQGFLAPTRRDDDRLALSGAQQELEAAQGDRRVALHGVEQARAALAVVQPSGGARRVFELQAPVSGSVLRVQQASEGSVAIGAPLLELGDTGRLEIVADLLTADALQAVPGSPVRIERWGGPQPLQGRVRRVEPAAFTKVSALGVEEQRVRVVIDLVDLTQAPPQWRALGDGFRVGVRVITRSTDAALKVPVGAVFPLAGEGGAGAASDGTGGTDGTGAGAGAGAMAVFAVVDGRVRLQRVSVTARNGSEAWIGSGLSPGTAVVVYPAAALRDGSRVKVRTAAA